MIRYQVGDLLSCDAEALVNTVNCVGVMGRGIALQFKKAFPDNFRAYAAACRRGEVRPGRMFVYEAETLTNPRFIVNFPTKQHWRSHSRLEDIDAGLRALREVVRLRGIRSIAVPPLGSGLGGLNWTDVRPRIHAALADLEGLQAVVFEPRGGWQALEVEARGPVPKMTDGRAALVALMHRYVDALLVPFVTLLEVHKLLYFMQVAGEPLRLRFRKAHYGPYAENLRHVLHAINGHFIKGYSDGGDTPGRRLKLLPGAVEHAKEVLNLSSGTRTRFERVTDLVEGFESPSGLELLATVHWVLESDRPTTSSELVRLTHAWNRKKRRFSAWQIKLAADVLRAKGWTD